MSEKSELSITVKDRKKKLLKAIKEQTGKSYSEQVRIALRIWFSIIVSFNGNISKNTVGRWVREFIEEREEEYDLNLDNELEDNLSWFERANSNNGARLKNKNDKMKDLLEKVQGKQDAEG